VNYISIRKRIFTAIFITSTLSFNLVAMNAAVANEGADEEEVTVSRLDVFTTLNQIIAQGANHVVSLLPAEERTAYFHQMENEVTEELLAAKRRENAIKGKNFLLRNSYYLHNSLNSQHLKLLGATGVGILTIECFKKVIGSEFIDPALKGLLKPGSSFLLRLLKKFCAIFRIPFKDSKRAEAEEINEREGALDIKRRGLQSDKQLLNDMRGMLNRKDPDYQEQLDQIKELEKQHKENVKEYFELRKELNKKETEYKVVAVEKQLSPQQAAAA